MEIVDKPVLPVNNASDVIPQIIGNPNCKLSGCHGKGYTGIVVRKDGSTLVQLCNCGRWAVTEYVQIITELKRIENSINENTVKHNALLYNLLCDELKQERLWARIKKLFQKKDAKTN